MQGLSQTPKLFLGGVSSDARGSVRFLNNFSFENVVRLYHVRNASVATIRAFHGHMKEGKYVYVARGSILLCFVKLTDVRTPSKLEPVMRVKLSDENPAIQYIPPGYANGFKVYNKNSDVIFFSTATLEESKNDDYRFDPHYWGKEMWKEIVP